MNPYWCTVRGPAHWGTSWEFAEADDPVGAASKAIASYQRFHPKAQIDNVQLQRWQPDYVGTSEYFTVANGKLIYSTDEQVRVAS